MWLRKEEGRRRNGRDEGQWATGQGAVGHRQLIGAGAPCGDSEAVTPKVSKSVSSSGNTKGQGKKFWVPCLQITFVHMNWSLERINENNMP